MQISNPVQTKVPVCCFFPLRGLSLTLTRANARFSQSSSVALRGGALLNRSWNTSITWDMVCPVCCLSCTHTLATNHSSIEQLLVSAIRKTQLHSGSVIVAKHVYTILHTVAKLPFYIVLHSALCCVNILSLRCVLFGCMVTSHPFCTGS